MFSRRLRPVAVLQAGRSHCRLAIDARSRMGEASSRETGIVQRFMGDLQQESCCGSI